MQRKYYLAYGSNLSLDQMFYRCPFAKVEGRAVLEDWQLLFRGSKTGAYLTIEPCEGSQVPVGVFSITPSDEYSLDRYEGYPIFYRKETMKVSLISDALDVDPQEIEAMVYIMDSSRPIGVPSEFYVDVVSEGYEDFGFDLAPLFTAYAHAINNSSKLRKEY